MRIRAARLVEHGQPLQIEDLDVEPDAGEVLVELAYAGVNPVDRYNALGRVAADGPLPRTLGSEGAGRADGRPVLVRGHGLSATRDGLWSTAALAPREALVEIPDGVALEAAAAMGVAGVTAWRTVTEKARVTDQDRVLVLGASGGVGSIVVSVVKAIGATVWGQTANPAKADWVRQRGAHEVIVSDASGLAEAAGGLQPTVVIDPLGDGFTGAAVELLTEHGRLVIFGTSADGHGDVPLQSLYRKGLTVYGYGGLIEPDDVMATYTAQALEALRDARMEVTIDRVVPLDRVNDALRALEERQVLGKLVLDLQAS